MVTTASDARLALVSRLTAALRVEVGRRDPRAAVPWAAMPDVQAVVTHVGQVHRWVTEIVRTRGPVLERLPAPRPWGDAPAWYDEGRAALLDALAAAPPDAPCWILGDRVGTAAFWRRRMVHENAKHLIDLRASGGGEWAAARELAPDDCADGVDELLSEFLPRSRPALPPLPGAVDLIATDSGRAWRIDEDWAVRTPATGPAAAVRISARSADLALALWERAEPLRAPRRFQIDGSRAVAAALRAAPIHPW